MTEAELQAAILEVARLWGWRVAHFRPALTKHGWRTPVSADGKGFPDLVLVHERLGVVFAEVKSDRGRLSPEQVEWGSVLALAGARMHLWRPSDWPAIVSLLSDGKAQVSFMPGGNARK